MEIREKNGHRESPCKTRRCGGSTAMRTERHRGLGVGAYSVALKLDASVQRAVFAVFSFLVNLYVSSLHYFFLSTSRPPPDPPPPFRGLSNFKDPEKD